MKTLKFVFLISFIPAVVSVQLPLRVGVPTTAVIRNTANYFSLALITTKKSATRTANGQQ